jgi:sarcosine oxidase subunit beta
MPEVVIIGGGVVGCSIAYHLASLGCQDITVLERGRVLGEGSTGKATGGFRAQFGTEVHVRLSLMARQKLLAFKEELGVDPGYRPAGYLFCASSESQLAGLRAANEVQQRAGLDVVEFLNAQQIAERIPQVHTDDLIGGSFCPIDGFTTPLAILYGYNQAARKLGVRFQTGETVTAIDRAADSVIGVATDYALYPTRQVINAAGPWAAEIAHLAGIPDLPVQPIKRQVAVTNPFNLLPPEMPMVIDAANGFHTRLKEGRALLLWADPGQPPDFDTTFDPAFLGQVLPMARHRIPAFEQASIDPRACYAGLYEVTPDHHGIVGWSPQVKGLFLANGFSGHGVMHAPAIGHLAAEMILGRQTKIDISALRPSRFAEGALNEEPAVI